MSWWSVFKAFVCYSHILHNSMGMLLWKSNHINECKLSVYFAHKKLLFLFYTHIFIKHLHQSIYSTHLFNKIFILLQFFIISSLTTPLSNRPNTTNDHSTPSHHHHPPNHHHQGKPTHSIRLDQPLYQKTHWSNNEKQKKAKSSPTQLETHWSNNKKQRKSEVNGEASWWSARDQWRWWSATVARNQGRQEV